MYFTAMRAAPTDKAPTICPRWMAALRLAHGYRVVEAAAPLRGLADDKDFPEFVAAERAQLVLDNREAIALADGWRVSVVAPLVRLVLGRAGSAACREAALRQAQGP